MKYHAIIIQIALRCHYFQQKCVIMSSASQGKSLIFEMALLEMC